MPDGGVPQVEDSVERQREAEDLPFLRLLLEARGPVDREMTTPLSDEDPVVPGKVEGRLALVVPAVLVSPAGIAEVEDVVARTCWDVAEGVTRPAVEVCAQGMPRSRAPRSPMPGRR